MADKGIRVNVNHKFIELLPKRAELGNAGFRKAVVSWAADEFGITWASACTHYNHAFIEARKAAVADANLAELLVGLGRPEDKKGGRKKKVVAVAEATTGETVPEQTVFTVKKKADGSVVAENLSFEQAQELIAKAKSAKKAALYFV